MDRSAGLTLRRVAGGGALFALSFGALASPGQSVMAQVASTAPAVALAASDPDRHPRQTVRRPVPVYQEATAATAAPKTAPESVMAATPIQPLRSAARSKTVAATAPAPPPARISRPATAGGNTAFAFGYCTWWVAHKRSIPWRGDAAQWWWNARAYGFAEGQSPRVGAIMVMAAGGAAAPEGHVAYVESVNPDGSFVVSEMNWWGVPGGGWGRVNYRTVRSMRGILGFIFSGQSPTTPT